MSLKSLKHISLQYYSGLFVLCCIVLFSSFSFQGNLKNIGDKLPDFKLKNVNSQWVSLENYSDAKGYVIVFICNHCPCTGNYEKRLIAIDKKYKALGYPVIAINSMDPVKYPTESLEMMKARASMKGYTFPYLIDSDKQTAIAYGATTTPYVCILKKDNNQYTLSYSGLIDDNMLHPERVKEKYIEKALDELLAGKKIGTTTTKAFGCSLYH